MSITRKTKRDYVRFPNGEERYREIHEETSTGFSLWPRWSWVLGMLSWLGFVRN